MVSSEGNVLTRKRLIAHATPVCPSQRFAGETVDAHRTSTRPPLDQKWESHRVLERRPLWRAAERGTIVPRRATHRCWDRPRQQTRRLQRALRSTYLPQHTGRSQNWGQGSRKGLDPHAPYPQASKNAVSEAPTKPASEQKETPAVHQSPLALEAAPCYLALPAFSGERLCGGRHQSGNPWPEALGSAVFAVGGGETLVLCRTRQACPRGDQTGLRNQSLAEAVGPQEHEQKAGRGVGSPLRRLLGTGQSRGRGSNCSR